MRRLSEAMKILFWRTLVVLFIAWLMNHSKYGATLRAWRENGTVPRKAKWIASIMMLISGIIMLFTNAPLAVKIFTDLTMFIVAVWLWLRPEPRSVLTGKQQD